MIAVRIESSMSTSVAGCLSGVWNALKKIWNNLRKAFRGFVRGLKPLEILWLFLIIGGMGAYLYYDYHYNVLPKWNDRNTHPISDIAPSDQDIWPAAALQISHQGPLQTGATFATSAQCRVFGPDTTGFECTVHPTLGDPSTGFVQFTPMQKRRQIRYEVAINLTNWIASTDTDARTCLEVTTVSKKLADASINGTGRPIINSNPRRFVLVCNGTSVYPFLSGSGLEDKTISAPLVYTFETSLVPLLDSSYELRDFIFLSLDYHHLDYTFVINRRYPSYTTEQMQADLRNAATSCLTVLLILFARHTAKDIRKFLLSPLLVWSCCTSRLTCLERCCPGPDSNCCTPSCCGCGDGNDEEEKEMDNVMDPEEELRNTAQGRIRRQ